MAALWAELLKLDQVGRTEISSNSAATRFLPSLSWSACSRRVSRVISVRFSQLPPLPGLAPPPPDPTTSQRPPNLIPAGMPRPSLPEMLPLVKLTQPQIDQILTQIPGGVANLQDIYPLAPLQEGMFLPAPHDHNRATPISLPSCYPSTRAPRLQSFLESLHTVVQRHDVLRTGVVSKGLDEPLQFVLRQTSVPTEELTFAALQDVSAETAGSTLIPKPTAWISAWRLCFASPSPHDSQQDRWLLLLLSHHLILDHTAQEILVFEFRALMANAKPYCRRALPYRNFIAQTRSGSDTRQAQEDSSNTFSRDIEEPTAPFGLPTRKPAVPPSKKAR